MQSTIKPSIRHESEPSSADIHQLSISSRTCSLVLHCYHVEMEMTSTVSRNKHAVNRDGSCLCWRIVHVFKSCESSDETLFPGYQHWHTKHSNCASAEVASLCHWLFVCMHVLMSKSQTRQSAGAPRTTSLFRERRQTHNVRSNPFLPQVITFRSWAKTHGQR